MDLLIDGLTLSSNSEHWFKKCQGHVGTEMSGVRARAGGAAFSQTEEQTEVVSLLSPPLTQPAGTISETLSACPQNQHTQWPASNPIQPPLQTTHPKGKLSKHQSPAKEVLLHSVNPCTAVPPLQSRPVLMAD